MEKESLARAQKLVKLGLTDNEARIYIAALELGRSTVTKISRSAGVSRTNAYNILDLLSEKGLVRVTGKEPKEEYVAESPTSIVQYFEKQHAESEKQLQNARDLAPELAVVQKVSDRPQVKFYEGVDGMEHVYEDTLSSTETIRAYGNYDVMYEAMGAYFPEYYKRRAKKGISVRAIVPDSTLAQERKSKNVEEARDLALVPKEQFSITPDIEIYDNKIMITSWKEKLGIIIESQEIADAMKKIFEFAWIGAKTLGGNESKRV